MMDKPLRLHNLNARTNGIHKPSKLKSMAVGFVQKKIIFKILFHKNSDTKRM